MLNDLKSRIKYETERPNIDQYWILFNSTGWNKEYKFSIEELETAIEKSWYSISVYINQKLIGFGRILSDGIHHALIVDLIIYPKYQGNGIGSEILKRLLKVCTEKNIRDIQLFSATGKSKFYEKYGFQKRNENSPGMEYVY